MWSNLLGQSLPQSLFKDDSGEDIENFLSVVLLILISFVHLIVICCGNFLLAKLSLFLSWRTAGM
jgi:hypothetical protein